MQGGGIGGRSQDLYKTLKRMVLLTDKEKSLKPKGQIARGVQQSWGWLRIGEPARSQVDRVRPPQKQRHEPTTLVKYKWGKDNQQSLRWS